MASSAIPARNSSSTRARARSFVTRCPSASRPLSAAAASSCGGGELPASDGAPRAARPAFYALDPGGWRDYVTLLHLPYTAWHLSYVVVGGCLAASVAWGRLGLTVLAFALAMGVGAHALDELHGRPLGTRIPSRAQRNRMSRKTSSFGSCTPRQGRPSAPR